MTSREEKKKQRQRKREEQRDDRKAARAKALKFVYRGTPADAAADVRWLLWMPIGPDKKRDLVPFRNGLRKVVIFTTLSVALAVLERIIKQVVNSKGEEAHRIRLLPSPRIQGLVAEKWEKIQQKMPGGFVLCDSLESFIVQEQSLYSWLRLQKLREAGKDEGSEYDESGGEEETEEEEA